MPIPDERLPQLDDEEAVESAARPEMLDEEDELEFESAEADTADDEVIQDDEAGEPDTASFGFGDPAD
jgi:hypothetical protein